MKKTLLRTAAAMFALAFSVPVFAEGYGDLIIDRDGDGVEDACVQVVPTENWVGVWQDSVTERACMTVTNEDDTLMFEVTWADSAESTAVWTFSGIPGEDGVIRFTDGCLKNVETSADGTQTETVVYENSEGVVAIDENGAIYWYDTSFEESSSLCFERISE